MQYHSHTFLKDLKLEPLLLKIQDSSLPEEKLRELLCSILNLFAEKSKDVIKDCVRGLHKEENEEYIRMISITSNTYQSFLARNLCKMWSYVCDKNSDTKTKEREFISFVKEKVGGDVSVDEDFITLSRSFFGNMKHCKDLSHLIPSTTSMKRIGELYKELAWSRVERNNAQIKEQIGWLPRRSDFDNISTTVGKKLEGKLGSLTMEDVKREIDTEINLLYQERQEAKPQQTDEEDTSNKTSG